MSNKILIVAGDHSADIYCAGLAGCLLKKSNNLEIFALGGEKLKALPEVKFVYNLVNETVMGFYEVLKKYFTFRCIYREVVLAFLKQQKPCAVVLVDFYGFNINVARAAKELKIPVIYYISPKIWAWNTARIKKLKEFVDKMLVIFPFEEELFRKAGMDVVYVGNPLLDIVCPGKKKQDILKEFNLKEDLPIVGLMPGSRMQEVDYILPVMLASAKTISEKQKAQYVLILAGSVPRSCIERKYNFEGINCKIVEDKDYNLRSIMTLALTAAGTATLENAYLGLPMIIVYKMSRISYLIAKRLVRIPDIGLANIVAGKRIVPELIQNEASRKNISDIAVDWLKNPDNLTNIRNELVQVRKKMGQPGVNDRVAGIINDFIKKQDSIMPYAAGNI